MLYLVAMQAASKNMYQVLQETYEEDWDDYENVKSQLNVRSFFLISIG